MDCRSCVNHRDQSHTHHISCHHPLTGLKDGDALTDALAILGSVGRVGASGSLSAGLNVKLNPHGVKNGWANWPWAFDPIWVESCDGYDDGTAPPKVQELPPVMIKMDWTRPDGKTFTLYFPSKKDLESFADFIKTITENAKAVKRFLAKGATKS